MAKFFHLEQSCPRCGTVLDDENWCEECGQDISDGEIAAHEQMYGTIWDCATMVRTRET